MMSKEIFAKTVSIVFNAYIGLLFSYFVPIIYDRNNIPNYIELCLLILIMFGLLLFLFKKFGLISDLEVTDRSERPLLNFASLIPAFVVLLISTNTTSALLFSVSIILIVVNVVQGIVSFFWKISGHLLYISTLATITTVIFFSWYLFTFWIISLPIVAWSRVYLKKHTYSQVIAGFITSFIITIYFL